MTRSRVQHLRDKGFDLSESIPFESTHRVRCSQCEALVINGTPCHETGCRNQKRRSVEEEES